MRNTEKQKQSTETRKGSRLQGKPSRDYRKARENKRQGI